MHRDMKKITMGGDEANFLIFRTTQSRSINSMPTNAPKITTYLLGECRQTMSMYNREIVSNTTA